MLTLESFPPITLGKVTVCENDGQLDAVNSSEAAWTAAHLLGENNVSVVIGQESARPAYSIYAAKDAFSAQTETLWQRLVSAYYENGLEASIRELSSEEDALPIASNIAAYILKLFDAAHSVKYYLSSYPRESPSHTLSESSGSIGNVVLIAWHQHTCKLAAVFLDDTVRVFGKGKDLTPVLKHRLQKNIVNIEWMPYYSSILAVGCQSGILLWILDPVSVVSRPSGSCLTHLVCPNISPTTSLSWHPKGLNLVCVGGKGREIVLWDITKEDYSIIYSGFASSFSYLLWSPDGNRLLAAMNTSVLRVFECRNWSYERWSLAHPLQSAVWSSCGQLLLFVTRNDPYLYTLTFSQGEGVGGSQVATQVADFTSIFMTTDCGEEIKVGGRVKQLAWDPNSERLAVVFKDSEYVALYHTYTYPQFHLAPGGFVQGEEGQWPIHASFQKNVSGGAVLTVVWSGGRVNHIALRYTERDFKTRGKNFGRPLNESLLGTSFAGNNSHIHNVTLGFSSPLQSPLNHLFTSP